MEVEGNLEPLKQGTKRYMCDSGSDSEYEERVSKRIKTEVKRVFFKIKKSKCIIHENSDICSIYDCAGVRILQKTDERCSYIN
jgi:hypothetical protein